jgi:uncharacterized protein (TIGR02646 family)
LKAVKKSKAMIKIERETPPADTAMDRTKEGELRKIRKLVESGKSTSTNIKFKALWSTKSDPSVKDFLYKSQHGKCCYCEIKRGKREFDVEHFRPKGKVTGDKRNLSGYWWLAYNWENLLIACKMCNQKKGTHFPLKDESKRAYGEKCDIEEEEPFLINPLKENPELFIDYDLRETKLMVKAIGRCERGEKTVNKLTGINDRHVMEQRADRLKFYQKIRNEMRNGDDKLKPGGNGEMRELISPDSTFSGFAKFYFRKEGCL